MKREGAALGEIVTIEISQSLLEPSLGQQVEI